MWLMCLIVFAIIGMASFGAAVVAAVMCIYWGWHDRRNHDRNAKGKRGKEGIS